MRNKKQEEQKGKEMSTEDLNEGIMGDIESMMSGGIAGGDDILASLDFSQVKDNFRLLPINDEDGKPIDYEWRISQPKIEKSSSGNHMFTFKATCVYPADCEGVSLTGRCVLTPESLWVMKSLASSVGLLDEDGANILGGASDFAGKITCANIRHNVWEGQTRNAFAGGFKKPTQMVDGNELVTSDSEPSF